MKRIIVMLCAAVMIAVSLCSCVNTSAGKVDEKATQAVSGVKPTERKNIAATDSKEKVKPTDGDSELMETIVDAVATEWDEMVQDGEVEDGDGNVGDLENHDSDSNYDPDAVD